MNKKNSIITALGGVLFIVVIIFFVYPKASNKIAYIKLNEVYQKFTMREEMENKYKAIEASRKNLIDSIEFKATSAQASGDLEKYKQILDEYIKKRQELEQANKILSRQYEEQVWNQINSYCQEYGKKKEYDFVFGAEGSGNIMYANAQKDVTKEVIEYINEMYHGKQEKTK
jgi:outer membrane protein